MPRDWRSGGDHPLDGRGAPAPPASSSSSISATNGGGTTGPPLTHHLPLQLVSQREGVGGSPLAVTTARKALAAFSAAGGHWRCAKSMPAAASLTLAGATVHSRSASAAPRSPPALAVAM